MLELLIGSDREEDEYHFFRNLHMLAAQSKKENAVDHGELLENLLGELSFWNAVSEEQCADDRDAHLQPGQKRRRSRTTRPAWNASAGSLSFASRYSSKPSQEDTSGEPSLHKHQPVWKTAVDPATGQTYYYDSISRHTQWHKPPEIKAMEKKRKEERRKRDAIFFKEMERNILESLKRGELIPGVKSSSTHRRKKSVVVNVGPPREPASPPPHHAQLVTGPVKPGAPRIRTISGMDEVLLAELRDDKNTHLMIRPVHHQRQPEHGPKVETHSASSGSSSKLGRPPLPVGPSKRAIHDDEEFDSDPMELSPDPAHTDKYMHPFHRDRNTIGNPGFGGSDSDLLAGELFLDEPIQDETDMIAELTTGEGTPAVPAPGQAHVRRNTGGTIYLQNTIYNPDIKATIKCVCGVYRAHIVQAAEQQSSRSPVSVVKEATADSTDTLDVKVFYDMTNTRGSLEPSVPSLADVLAFYEEFYGRSQMEHDTIIMSLIYVERLVKATNGVLAPSPDNWRSVLFACMVLASKVWDDLSMWNIDFSNVSAATAGLSSFTLPRINQLELALLKSLNFDVRVPASEYAKYYFLIRTMLLRSGLVQEGAKPLQRKDDASFARLESLTAHYQDQTLGQPKTSSNTRGVTQADMESAPRPEPVRFRAQSYDGVLTWLHASSGDKPGPVLRDTVCLEQLVG